MPPVTPIPATVLGGYLGAGKTTLLNRLLAAPGGRRIGVLVNDIGEVSIDAALVADVTDDVVTLANGCICCTMTDGFAAALDPLRTLPLDAVVVECSGVAHPLAVAAHLMTPGFEVHGIIVMADASTIVTKAADRYVGTTVLRQLAVADLVVLNKVDLVIDAVDALTVVRRAAPTAPVLAVSEAAVDPEVVLGRRHRDGRVVDDGFVPAEHPTETFTWDGPLTRRELEAFLDGLGADVVRAKGLFDLVDEPDRRTVVQIVGARRSISTTGAWPSGPARRSVLVVIRPPS